MWWYFDEKKVFIFWISVPEVNRSLGTDHTDCQDGSMNLSHLFFLSLCVCLYAYILQCVYRFPRDPFFFLNKTQALSLSTKRKQLGADAHRYGWSRVSRMTTSSCQIHQTGHVDQAFLDHQTWTERGVKMPRERDVPVSWSKCLVELPSDYQKCRNINNNK